MWRTQLSLLPREKSSSNVLRRYTRNELKVTVEYQKEKTVNAKHAVEEAMTAALVNVCNACGRPFLKDDGCNKMTCLCGNSQCHVCSQNATYDHFGDDRCPLYDDATERERREVAAAQFQAVLTVLRKQKDMTQDELVVDKNLIGNIAENLWVDNNDDGDDHNLYGPPRPLEERARDALKEKWREDIERERARAEQIARDRTERDEREREARELREKEEIERRVQERREKREQLEREEEQKRQRGEQLERERHQRKREGEERREQERLARAERERQEKELQERKKQERLQQERARRQQKQEREKERRRLEERIWHEIEAQKRLKREIRKGEKQKRQQQERERRRQQQKQEREKERRRLEEMRRQEIETQNRLTREIRKGEKQKRQLQEQSGKELRQQEWEEQVRSLEAGPINEVEENLDLKEQQKLEEEICVSAERQQANIEQSDMKKKTTKEVREVIAKSVSEKKRFATTIMEMMLKILPWKGISSGENGNDLETYI